jgi:hypothetical protein
VVEVFQVPFTCTPMTASKSPRACSRRRVTHDARVVDDDVELAERVDRLLDELAGLLEVGDVGVVGNGRATGLLDQRDRVVGGPAGALTAYRAAQVVDDHLGALAGQLHCVSTADAVSGTGDDRDLAVEQTHPYNPLSRDPCHRQVNR